MIKNIKSVTIVGGGSAGWMSAAMFIKTFPHWNITIIESPDYPIVGVGESTLLGINEFFEYLELNDSDKKTMMRETDASYKMNIKFTDFYDKDSGGFDYPFGSPEYYSRYEMQDWFIKNALYPNTPETDFVDTYFPAASLWNNGKFSNNENKIFGEFTPDTHCSYHFDAVKLGQWLKNFYCIPRGVKLIVDTVKKISTNENGVEKLILISGEEIQSDLYVDCTGFKSLLLSNALKSEFTSYEHLLPNNRAWALRLPYKDEEKELLGYTNSTAIENGWCWNIPLWSRIGCGYVYSDKYVTPEDAKEEFKKYLMSDKMTVPRTRDEIEDLEYRDIKMRIGNHKESFYKNVVAIGLSAGFIEPLESNGLMTVHNFLFKLMKCLLRESVNQFDRDAYNKETNWFFKNFAEFVALHYALSIRNDTQYWKDITDKQFDNTILDDVVQNTISFHDLSIRKYRENCAVPDPSAGITYISTGMNFNIYDRFTFNTDKWLSKNRFRDLDELHEIFSIMENTKNIWLTEAEKSPTLYKYLKENIHTGE